MTIQFRPEVWPQPLDQDEQRKLACLAQEGDAAAAGRLVECNLRLIAAEARDLSDAGHYEDLIQVGVLAMLDRIDRYDPRRGSFPTYAMWNVRARMRRYLKKESRHEMLIHVDDPDVFERVEDAQPLPWKTLADAEDRRILHRLVSELPERLRIPLTLYFGLDGSVPRSLNAVGSACGYSREWARVLIGKAVKELRAGFDVLDSPGQAA